MRYDSLCVFDTDKDSKDLIIDTHLISNILHSCVDCLVGIKPKYEKYSRDA